MYWIALNDANYKVASFKRSYNGNQKRRFVWATGLEAKGFTVLNISNVTNPMQKLMTLSQLKILANETYPEVSGP